MNTATTPRPLTRRISMAISAHEEKALRWKARQMGLLNGGRPTASPVLRDHSLKAVVAEYDKRPQ
jgi:hypothetical protein